MAARKSYGKSMGRHRRMHQRQTKKRSAFAEHPVVIPFTIGYAPPGMKAFMIGYKRYEDDTTRIETRLLFAKNQHEADKKAMKYLSEFWGNDTTNLGEDGYESPDGGVIVQYRGSEAASEKDVKTLRRKGDVWKI